MKPFTPLLHLFFIKNIVPRVIIRHMTHVVNTPYHELPYGELLTRIFHAFDVPFNEKDATQLVLIDYFKELFLNMCGLKRENEICWLGTGENRRREEEEGDPEEESEDDESELEEKEKDASSGELTPTATKGKSSKSMDDFYDAEDGGTATDGDIAAIEGPT
ncbi:hypothetical protein Dimus_010428 [Dionaea muscipula]